MQIRIYNEALTRALTPNEAKVYTYLIACANRLNNAVVGIDTIRAACFVESRSTVYKALAGLTGKNLIHKYNRRSYDGDYIANGYTITQLRGGWFTVDTQDMQLFRLDKSTFLVYLYFLKCKRHNSRKVFPSLNRITAALRICKNTVIRAIRQLIRLLLIGKSRPSEQGRLNIYLVTGTIISALEPVYAGNRQQDPSARLMVSAIIRFVKRVFRGAVAFLQGMSPLHVPPFFRIGGSGSFFTRR